MNLRAVSPPPADVVRPPARRHVMFRYDWANFMAPDGRRAYFARVNESLVLNVHRHPGSNTWEYLVVGFDLTHPDTPLIGHVGKTSTMAEAKYLAEQKVPDMTPGTQEVLPF